MKRNKLFDQCVENCDSSVMKEVSDNIDKILDNEDLEKFAKKIKTFQARYEHPEIVSIKGAMAFMARMFYQYPNTARKWYEQLPKATMD